ncbi:MAG TPA: hypothetical protein VGJ55_03350 [Pyrinomonadaceae bacterium]
MQNRRIIIAFVSLAVATSFLMAWSRAWSQRPTQTPTRSSPQRGVFQTLQKPKVSIDVDYKAISAIEPKLSPEVLQNSLNKSMKKRRDFAWQIVKRVWAPVQVQGGQIPTWMTWYEQEDIEELYGKMLNQPKPPTRAEASKAAIALLRSHAVKDLQTSLSSARLGKVLRQFTFPAFQALGPNRKPGTGNIYYSPSYVKHLLENADNIARCNPTSVLSQSITLPKLVSPQQGGPRRGEAGAAQRQPQPGPAAAQSGQPVLKMLDPSNIYALCMSQEMPPDAVMIKVAWSPVLPGSPESFTIVNEPSFDVGPTMASKLSAGPAGQWIETSSQDPELKFSVTDEQGKHWALMGMHIASKTLRTWMWTSLFPASGYFWRGDKPDLAWPNLYHYQMCTVSDFKEGDPAPWAAYDGTGSNHYQQLADAIKAVGQAMNGVQWCANPYIETNMARGNCIGCHQGSTESFLPGVVARERKFNISDFSFSFATNRKAIINMMRQHLIQQRLKATPK